MADVRSLLRSERASRRINHPQATYSTTGLLVCLVCHIQLKSESLWDSHLRSSQHAMRLQRIRDGTLGRPPGAPAPIVTETSSKKRKAEDGDSEVVEGKERKKTKGVVKANGLPVGFFDEEVDGVKDEEEIEDTAIEESKQDEVTLEPTDAITQLPTSQHNQSPPPTSSLPSNFFDSTSKAPPPNPPAPPQNPTPINETEWAAFELEMASPSTPIPTALHATATITALPLSAAELAARSTSASNLQTKDRKLAEIEGEKEDAARQLDEEFDEMEILENRVRKLREKREGLRRRKREERGGVEGGDFGEGKDGEKGRGEEEGDMKIPIRMNGDNGVSNHEITFNSESDDDDDDLDEDWDGWMGSAH
ncbi:MAG: hypothetical protein M1812_003950 [Candelaria pacifica]|nr:MAG: hypothetical protein M1812_003950 [Candelaria pacifica]